MRATVTFEATVTLENEIVDELQKEAVASGCTLDQVLSDSIRRGCAAPTQPVSRRAPFRVKPLPVEFKLGVDLLQLSKLNDDMEIDGVLLRSSEIVRH